MSLAFVKVIHCWPMDSSDNGPIMRNMFPFDDVIMYNKIGLNVHLLNTEHESTLVNIGWSNGKLPDGT